MMSSFSDVLAAAGFDEEKNPYVRHVQFEGTELYTSIGFLRSSVLDPGQLCSDPDPSCHGL